MKIESRNIPSAVPGYITVRASVEFHYDGKDYQGFVESPDVKEVSADEVQFILERFLCGVFVSNKQQRLKQLAELPDPRPLIIDADGMDTELAPHRAEP